MKRPPVTFLSRLAVPEPTRHHDGVAYIDEHGRVVYYEY